MASSSNSPIILFQYRDDPLKHDYHQDGKSAFTVQEYHQKEDPNRVIRLVRDTAWVNQHPTVLGPDRSYFYMGPGDAMHMGYLMYGGGTSKFQMLSMLRPGKKEESRYWKSQNNVSYKWKVTPHRMECLHKRQTLAVWEVIKPDEKPPYYAKLTISPAAMPLVTELMTTLVLNQMALGLTWPTLDSLPVPSVVIYLCSVVGCKHQAECEK